MLQVGMRVAGRAVSVSQAGAVPFRASRATSSILSLVSSRDGARTAVRGRRRRLDGGRYRPRRLAPASTAGARHGRHRRGRRRRHRRHGGDGPDRGPRLSAVARPIACTPTGRPEAARSPEPAERTDERPARGAWAKVGSRSLTRACAHPVRLPVKGCLRETSAWRSGPDVGTPVIPYPTIARRALTPVGKTRRHPSPFLTRLLVTIARPHASKVCRDSSGRCVRTWPDQVGASLDE